MDYDFTENPERKDDHQPGTEFNESLQFSNINELLNHYDECLSDNNEDNQETDLFNHPAAFDQQIETLNTEFKLSPPHYVTLFDKNIQDESLFVGAISLEEIQKEERSLRVAHVKFLTQIKEHEREYNEKLQLAEKAVKTRLAQEFKIKRNQLQMEKNALLHAQRAAKEEINSAFLKSEKQMLEKLTDRKAEVNSLYGDMQMLSGVFTGPQNRRWKIDWSEAPQPIEIKIDCLRGVRDKLPGGRYVLFASLFSHLGGELIQWSKLPNQKWGAATEPIFHHGKFPTPQLMFDESVTCILPPRKYLIPTMIVTVELFRLGDSKHPLDTALGWGVLPVCDSEFNLIQGKYKIPFLRGRMDRTIECHYQINNLISFNLDSWLANLYVEILPKSRYLANQEEFEVELQLSSQLLNFPDRFAAEFNRLEVDRKMQPPYTSIWNKGAVHQSDRSLNSPPDYSPPGSVSAGYDSALPSTAQDDDESKDSQINSDAYSPRNRTTTKGKTKLLSHKLKSLKSKEAVSSSYKISRLILKEESFQTVSDSQPIDQFKPLKGHDGVYYKKNKRILSDDVHIDSFIPITSRMKQNMKEFKPKVTKTTRLQSLEEHTFYVQSDAEKVSGTIANANRRFLFFNRMISLELGLPNWRSSDLWILLFFLVLCWFLRLYLHYCGQWLFLTISGIPINNFEFYTHTVYLNYQWTLLSIPQESAVVLLGPLFNIFVLIILMIISGLAQVCVLTFPNMVSQFIFAFALMTLLDPLLILIVDCSLHRYRNLPDTPIGDAAKLYHHFMLVDDSGIPGILLVLIIYMTLFSITLSLVYIFLLRIHKKGRILDIYWRLEGSSDHFFIPLDMELSPEELEYHSNKARQWRGEEGERRKITVIDYEWQNDPDINDANNGGVCLEKTTYILIETISLDGLRQLHRHFLCLPDGAIIEILDLKVDYYFDHLEKATSTKPIKGSTQNNRSELLFHPPPAKPGEAIVFDDEQRKRRQSSASSIRNFKASQDYSSGSWKEMKQD